MRLVEDLRDKSEIAVPDINVVAVLRHEDIVAAVKPVSLGVDVIDQPLARVQVTHGGALQAAELLDLDVDGPYARNALLRGTQNDGLAGAAAFVMTSPDCVKVSR